MSSRAVGRRLRIGINALYMIPGEVGGTEIYLRELLAALAAIDSVNEYVVFINQETRGTLLESGTNFRLLPQPIHARSRSARIAWEQAVLPIRCAEQGIDVLLNPGYTAPLLCALPQVTVFHDLQHLRHPENFGRWEHLFWRFFLWGSAHRSAKLVSISNATRDDLLECYRLDPMKVRLIHHGVHGRFFAIQRERIEPFWLCVAAHRPNKNLERLVRAFASCSIGGDLVLVGPTSRYTDRVEKAAAECGVRDRVKIKGWIPAQELESLYSRAQALILPAMFEGFGMPILEAMAAGVPVACSDIPALREIAEDAAYYFDPQNPESMAGALERMTADAALRNTLASKGRSRSREFSWEHSARAMLSVLTEAAQPARSKN